MMLNEQAEIIIVIIAGILILLLFLGFIIIFLFFYQRKKYKYLKEKVELKTQLEIQEQTFKNISQEIHDNIGQALSFVKLSINTVDVYNPEDTKGRLLESKKLLTKTIQDLRDLSKTLNTDFIKEIGLAAAIEQQLFFLQKTGLYVTSFLVSGEVYKNPPQTEIVLYRIVQELLNNIVKHAAASTIKINIDYETERMIIMVEDDGKGFHQPDNLELNEHGGLGLQNMINRMTMIKGYITVDSEPGKGTKALIELPKQTL